MLSVSQLDQEPTSGVHVPVLLEVGPAGAGMPPAVSSTIATHLQSSLETSVTKLVSVVEQLSQRMSLLEHVHHHQAESEDRNSRVAWSPLMFMLEEHDSKQDWRL